MKTPSKQQCIAITAKVLNVLHGQPIKSIYGGVGQILMFHRVIPKTGKTRLFANSYLEVTPEYLEWTINYFKSHGYIFLSINSLEEHLKKKKASPFVVYTFDDGFKDNLHYAYPIFEKHQVPFTIYITTDFPNHKAILWWNHLETLVMDNQFITINLDNSVHNFPSKTQTEKTTTFKTLSRLIKHGDPDKCNERLKQIFHPYEIDPFIGIEKLALSWNEVEQLHSQPLVTIGSHTVSHPTLNKLTDKDAPNEIIGAKKLLEDKLGSEIKHFAYPFGGPTEIGKREVEFVKEARISTAVTTYSANIFNKHNKELHALPRIAVGMSMNENTFDLIRFGVIPMIRSRGKRIVTI